MRACHLLVQWRLEWATLKAPGLETLDYTKIGKRQSVTTKLQEVAPGGVNVCTAPLAYNPKVGCTISR
jgi:hypothetical protein